MKTTSVSKRLDNNRAPRRASALVLTALGMVTLLGFCAIAVDYGMLVADANRMQRASDAAALSGATELVRSGLDATSIASDTSRARALAAVVARRNGAIIDPNTDVTFPAYNRIRVESKTTRSFFFARVLGTNSSLVRRNATAGRVAISGLTGAAPLAITTNDFNTYRNGTSFEVKLIRNQDTNFDPGTATALDLRLDNSGKSPTVFERDMQYGYEGRTVLNQPINNALNADEGAQGARLEDAIADRMSRAAGAPWFDTGNSVFPNYPVGTPRIVTLMVADPNPADNNNPSITARAFVNVYLESVRSPERRETFVRMRILPSTTYNSQDPNTNLDQNAPITGPSALVLIS